MRREELSLRQRGLGLRREKFSLKLRVKSMDYNMPLSLLYEYALRPSLKWLSRRSRICTIWMH